MISLIVTGQERNEHIERLVNSVLLSDFPGKIQLIFINQERYYDCSRFSFPNNVEFIEIVTPKISLSKARNLGIIKSSGEIICFPDDDCWYPVDLLNQIWNLFHNDDYLSAICTNVFDPELSKSYGNRPFINEKINYFNLFKLPISVGIFIRSTSLSMIGAFFDERLGAGTELGSGEETELIYRLIRLNGAIYYYGNLNVFHSIPLYDKSEIIKYYKYGLGFGFLNGKILRDGEFRVLYYFVSVLVRSLAGSLVYLHRSSLSNLYWNRLLGIVKGFVRGVRD